MSAQGLDLEQRVRDKVILCQRVRDNMRKTKKIEQRVRDKVILCQRVRVKMRKKETAHHFER